MEIGAVITIIVILVLIVLIVEYFDAIVTVVFALIGFAVIALVGFIIYKIVVSINKKNERVKRTNKKIAAKLHEMKLEELILKISEREKLLLCYEDKELIKSHIMPSLFPITIKEDTPTNLRDSITILKECADQQEISIFDDNIATLESCIGIIEDNLRETEVKASQSIGRDDLRYSTVNVLFSDINQTISEVQNAFNRVESMSKKIDKTIDDIFYLRDEALLKPELIDTNKKREIQLIGYVKNEIEKFTTSLSGNTTSSENAFENLNEEIRKERSNIKEEPTSNPRVRPESKGYFSPLQQINKDRLDDIGTKTSSAHSSLTYSNVRQTVSNYTDEQLCHFVNHSTNSDLNKKPGFYYAVVTEIYLRLESEKVESPSAKEEPSHRGPEASSIETGRDGVYVAYANGIVRNTSTGLEWTAGPDKDTNWYEAKAWVEGLKLTGGSWQMPTIDELAGLYEKGAWKSNMTPILKMTGWWVWSGETQGSSDGCGFSFSLGRSAFVNRSASDGGRAFAVRT